MLDSNVLDRRSLDRLHEPSIYVRHNQMRTSLRQIISHPNFHPKMEAALEEAVRKKRVHVSDPTADEETVSVEIFRMSKELHIDPTATRAGEHYLEFSVSGEIALRYRDARSGEGEKTCEISVDISGFMEITTPDYDSPSLENAVQVTAIEIPLKDLAVLPL